MGKKFMADCESLCFDCGKPDPKHKMGNGVALCDDCHKAELEDEREALKIISGIYDEIK